MVNRRKIPLILIVDDESLVRNILDKMLQSLGYSVIQASNGTEAQGMIRQYKPDLVLLDMIMPGVHSLEVLTNIRTDSSLQHIAVILISGMNDLDMVTAFIKAGVHDFLPKPFNKALLTLKIDNCLAQVTRSNTAHDSRKDMNDFCRRLSHDLNNTLTGIMMTSELLLMGVTDQRQKAHLAEIIKSTEEITRIVHAHRQALTPNDTTTPQA